jgi:hypothetical protein
VIARPARAPAARAGRGDRRVTRARAELNIRLSASADPSPPPLPVTTR